FYRGSVCAHQACLSRQRSKSAIRECSALVGPGREPCCSSASITQPRSMPARATGHQPRHPEAVVSSTHRLRRRSKMEERAVRRWAAFAGLAFVVLLVISIVLTIPAPMPDKSTAKIVKWFMDHRQTVYTSSVLGGLATVVFLWFLGYLHHAVSRAAGSARALSSILLTS